MAKQNKTGKEPRPSPNPEGKLPEVYNQIRQFRSLMIDAVKHGMKSEKRVRPYPLEAHSRLQEVLDVVYDAAKSGDMYAANLYIQTMFKASERMEQQEPNGNNPNFTIVFNTAKELPNESE